MKRILAAPALVTFIFAFTAAGQTPIAVFKSEARLVEVYATVFDHRNKYVDGLTRDRFVILDNGEPQPVVAFESDTSSISCAIVMDTTGSMLKTLPVVKNALLRLVDEFRDSDWIAAYGFDTALNTLQDFTHDKDAVKRAVLRTRAAGSTALFDSISQVTREISRRTGKKAIVVFTDGADNASVLNARSALTLAKKTGVPIYTVAQGDALTSSSLMHQLKDMAEFTGALTYASRKPKDMEQIFADISSELQHTYMMAFKPPPGHDRNWRTIQLVLNGFKDYKVRAREGYIPE